MNETVISYLAEAEGLALAYAVKLVSAAAIFVIGRWLAKRLVSWAERLMAQRSVDAAVSHFMANLLNWGLLAAVVIAALGQLGVQTASLVAVVGAAGLAIGLALQGSLSNFAAGVLLLVFRPFKLGDYVEMAGTAGSVARIQIFTTELTSPDNKKIIVPNGRVIASNIVNYSANDTRRVDMVFSVSYGDDLGKAQQLLRDLLAAEPRVLAEPAPLVAVHTLADSSVNIIARPWVASGDYWAVHYAVTEAAKRAFDANGITIPFPQRVMHVEKPPLA